MRRIKLFVEGHWYDDPFQSTCAYIYGLYSRLSAEPDFEIFVAAKDPEKASKYFDHNPRINFVSYKSHSKFYRLAIDIPRLLTKHDIDIAHYQYVSPPVKKSREIVTLHDLLFKEFTEYFPFSYRISKDILFYASAKKADLITTVSNYSARSIREHYGIAEKKLFVTPNGVSEKFFNLTRTESNIKAKYSLKNYILYVSRIEPRKNHIQLLKAYTELLMWKKGIQLVMIGRKDIPVREMDQFLESLPAEVKGNIFHFTGIPEDELIAFYQNALLFVYPSIGEGFGIPPLEAAAVKSKVLCSNATAMSDFEFFANDLFDPHDREELKRKIVSKLDENDSHRLERISELILKTYNWDSIAAAFSGRIKTLHTS